MIAAVSLVAVETDWRLAERASFDGTATALGDALVSPFVLPFEVASVVLVVAMIGAIVRVRED